MINKALYSFWSKPNTGFNTEEDLINCLKLSLLFSKKWFDKTELVTDKAGKKLIIDKHKLDFDNVVVCLDKYNIYNERYWSIGKIVACSLQKEPFIHLDNDVIFFKKPPERILNSDASFQSKENIEWSGYKEYIIDANKNKSTKLDYTLYDCYNCGIIGFNKISDVLNEWLELAIKYMDYDNNYYDNNYRPFGTPCLIFEQYHIVQLLDKYNYNVSFLGEHITDALAKKIGYTHLISNSKKNLIVSKRVKNRLEKELKK